MVGEPAEGMDGEQGWDEVGFILLRATGMVLARRGHQNIACLHLRLSSALKFRSRKVQIAEKGSKRE